MAKNIVVTAENEIYFFEDKKLYEFLNEEEEWVPEDENDRMNWKVLSAFPTPAKEGSYCPFTYWNVATDKALWPTGSLIILRGDKLFVPEKRVTTRTITSEVYAPPARNRKKSVKAPAKKAASKK